MSHDWFEVTLPDLKSVLDERSLVGPARHLLIELYLVDHLREWERPHTESHFLKLLGLSSDDGRQLLQWMVRDDLISCSQDMKTGQVSCIALGSGIVEPLEALAAARCRTEWERTRAVRGPRPPTPGVKRQARDLFEGTCELCGDQAVRGKDQRGRDMVVSKVKKDRDGTADNVTLLCSKCSSDMRNRDLPSTCRTLQMIQISMQRGEEVTPRIAEKPPPAIKEVVLTVTGPISVKTRNLRPQEAQSEGEN